MISDKYYVAQRADRKRFERDTKGMMVTTLLDDGVTRHLRVSQPNSSRYWFDVVSFPGHMSFAGDRGAWMFARLRDMFEFHRVNFDRETPTIDYDYWASKTVAVDRHEGTHIFDEDAWKSAAVHDFRQYEFPEGRRMELWHEFRAAVFGGDAPRDSFEAIGRVIGFNYIERPGIQEYPFDDFWGWAPFEKPSPSFKWACWAIAETIRSYDRHHHFRVAWKLRDED